jgi:ABC-type uncharacterized transport system substrate-binding protein
MFLYGVGIQYGKQFFAGLAGPGLGWNLLGCVGVIASLLVALQAGSLLGLSVPVSVGLFAGSGTSTPTLQAALQRVKKIPIVFNYVADPFAAGAGSNDAMHLPNVTGVYLLGAYAQMVPMIRSYLPNARVLGTVYVPAEVNMVSQKAVLDQVVRAAGLELKAVAANSPSEVGDAALALVAAHVDAICQLPGNLTVAAFPSIAQAARRGRVPVFGFQSSQATSAVLTVARDYYDSGREAAKIAARIMRGESAAAIPFLAFSTNSIIVNRAAARTLGLISPAALVAKAQKVIE